MLRRTASAAAACLRGRGTPSVAGQERAVVSQLQGRGVAQSAVRRMAEEAAKQGGEEGAGSWLKDFAESKIRLFVAAGLGLLLLNAGASAAFDWYYHKQVLDTLVHGVLPPPVPPPALERPALRDRVRELLQPAEPSRFYHIVTGPPGGGKSTLLRQAVREMGGGVAYMEVSPAFEVDFGRDLGAAFNFRFQEHVNRLNIVFKPVLGTQFEDPRSKHPLASVRQSAEALHDAALDYRRRTGRPFVLVIDSADRLSRNEESEKVLGAMLEYARDWAQEGTITTLFVAHDWDTVEKLTGDHPAQSRAGPPVTVPDITGEEALRYLQLLGVTQPKQAQQCAELAGGSLLLLQCCAAMLMAGEPFAAAKEQLLNLIEIAYLRAGLLDATPQQHGGLAAIEALLASKGRSISAAEWRQCVPERERQKALLSKGVLRFDGRSVTFASNLAATYAEEQLRARLPKSAAEQHKGLGRASR